jgi:FkbM family methyltransferase
MLCLCAKGRVLVVLPPLDQLRRRTVARLADPAMRYALAGKPSPIKLACLRRIVLPGVAARAEDFEYEIRPGVVFRANTADYLPSVVRVFGRWEPALTTFLCNRLSPGRVFVDVGANVGWFELWAAPLVGPQGTVVAIEPSPAIFDQLKGQVSRNGLSNVRLVDEAVGAADGWVRIVDGPAWNSGQTATAVDVERPGTVVSRPLHEILTADEIRRCRIVKIDVEGGEFAVVRGIGPVLDELSADAEIVVEVNAARADSSKDAAELWATFTERGYHAYALPNDYTAGFLRDPRIPRAIPRLDGLPAAPTDVVFSRTGEPELPL